MQTVYNYEFVASMSVTVRCCCFFRPIQRCLTLTQWPGKLYPQNNDICLQLVRDREDDTLLHKDKDSGTRERESLLISGVAGIREYTVACEI